MENPPALRKNNKKTKFSNIYAELHQNKHFRRSHKKEPTDTKDLKIILWYFE